MFVGIRCNFSLFGTNVQSHLATINKNECISADETWFQLNMNMFTYPKHAHFKLAKNMVKI